MSGLEEAVAPAGRAVRSDFAERVFARVLEASFEVNRHHRGHSIAAPARRSPGGVLRALALAGAGRAGFSRRSFWLEGAGRRLSELAAGLDELAATYVALDDEPSRSLLVELAAFRVLGPTHVCLPPGREPYWRALRAAHRRHLEQRDTMRVGELRLNRYRVPLPSGLELLIHAHPVTLLTIFDWEQYAYRRAPAEVAVQPGDVVIDAGACWGDTALQFADLAGPGGRVYAFELEPANIEVLRVNAGLNPALGGRVELVERALWDSSGETLAFEAGGQGTAVERPAAGAHLHVETLTLDDFVEQRGIERVDFVKMDIEGAEHAALRGAEQTLRRFRPKLAIAAYHQEQDLASLPAFIEGLGLGYDLYLDHHTPLRHETVLYAAAPGAGGGT